MMKRYLSALLIVLLAVPASAQEVLPDLVAARRGYPTPMSQAQISDLLNRVARSHPGWGMLRKDGGFKCPTPNPNVFISCDYMVHGPTGWAYDILNDADGAATPQPSGGSALAPGQEIVFPWTVDTPTPTPTPTPAPTPQPTGITYEGIRNIMHDEIQVIWAQNERTFANLIDNLNAIAGKQDAFKDQLKAHDEKTSKIVAFFSDPKTITAVISSVLAYITARKM